MRLALRTLTVVWLLGALAQGSFAVELVVDHGDPVPASASLPGVTFATLETPVIGGSGEIAFFATISGTGVTVANDETLWAGPPEDLRLVAREGAADAPGTEAGTKFDGFNGPLITTANGGTPKSPILTAAGKVAFAATLSVPAATPDTDEAIYVYDPTDLVQPLRLVIREGQAAPDTEAGTVFDFWEQWTYNDAGIAVYAELSGPSVVSGDGDSGIWVGLPGAVELLLRDSDPSPGFAGTIRDFIPLGLTTNAAGDVAFAADVDITDTESADLNAVYVGSPSGFDVAVNVLVDRNDPPPPPPCVFADTVRGNGGSNRHIGPSGAVAFWVRLDCAPGGLLESLGVFLGVPSAPTQSVVELDDTGLVGTDLSVVNWNQINEYPVSAGDRLALNGILDTTSIPFDSRYVVYTGTAGAMSLLARSEDPNDLTASPMTAPGTGGEYFAGFGHVGIDASGRVAFQATLADGSLTKGIWYGTPGDLHAVAVGGNAYGCGARRRTLSGFSGPQDFPALFGTGNDDGLPSAVSDSGQVVFRSQSDESSGWGIFLSRSFPPMEVSCEVVPATSGPGLWVLAALLLLTAGFLVRRSSGAAGLR